MLVSRSFNNRINRQHERCLRMIYNDKYSNFDGLLINVNYFSVPHNNIHALTIEMYKVENGVSSETKDKIFKVKCRSPLL